MGTAELLTLAMDEWSRVLHGLNQDQIRYALDSLPEDWPPTPRQFRGIALSLATRAQVRSLPAPVDREGGKKNMAEIKKGLGLK